MPDGYTALLGQESVRLHDRVLVYEDPAIGIPGGTTLDLPFIFTEFGRSFPNPKTVPHSVAANILISNSKTIAVWGWFSMAAPNAYDYRIKIYEMRAIGAVAQLANLISGCTPFFNFEHTATEDVIFIQIENVVAAPGNINDGQIKIVSRI